MTSPIGSADRILAILDLFSELRPVWTTAELLAELGYTRPTLYRYLKTLKETGFLSTQPGRGVTLGPRVVEMDYLMRRADPLVQLGQPHLGRLSKAYPGTAFIVRWYRNKILCVASSCTAPDSVTSYPRGRPMPLGKGAVTRVILANLPRQRQLPLIRENLQLLRETSLGNSIEDILENLRTIRRDGVAQAEGEVTPGVVGLAAPVMADGPEPTAALCFTVNDDFAASSLVGQIRNEVRIAAIQLSSELTDSSRD